MAKMIPPFIHNGCTSPGEYEIFRRLKDDPGTSDWIILHSLDIATHKKQVSGEIDFLIIIPRKGIICLEVKACHSLNRSGGLWYYGANPKPDARGPFKQASEGMHSIRAKLIEKRPDFSRVIFWSAVIFPYLNFSVQSNEWHPWQVIDNKLFKTQPISLLLGSILDSARLHLTGCPSAVWFHSCSQEPYPEQCEMIANILRPSFEFYESPKSRITRTEEELKFYTEAQYVALDAMATNQRVVFTGPAGTGKTLLAIEAARRGYNKGRKVLFLCFNKLLGKWLEIQTKDLKPQVTTYNLHRYMLELTGESQIPNTTEFWEHYLPEAAMEKIINNYCEDNLFDELIIDEAQDILTDSYMSFLDLILKGGISAGRWLLFGDFEKQSIYGRSSLALEDFIKKRGSNAPVYSLRVNCRNTPRVTTLVHLLGGLSPEYSKTLRPDDGIEPELIYYKNQEEQQSKLINSLEKLYKKGFTGSDIVILSSKNEMSCAVLCNIQPWKNKLRPYESSGKNDYIGYCTIHAFKGLESAIVIVTDIDFISDQIPIDLFYIAITRTLDRLIIFVQENSKNRIIEMLLNYKKGSGGAY